jgi:hypothetical protein
MSIDQIVIIGPKYLKEWHFCNDDNEFNIFDLRVSKQLYEDENIVDGMFYPNSPFFALITDQNYILLYKSNV